MNNLLSIEWMKVKKYPTFWIMAGMFAFLLPLWNYGINKGFLKMDGGKSGIDLIDKAYNFNNVWGNLGWWTSVFVVFISVLVIILTTNEYSFRTNRQNIIDGWTRLQALHAKWLMVFALAFSTTLYVFITGVTFGMANDTFSNFPGDMTSLFYVFILSLNYYGFALLIAYFFKRSGIGIGIFFLYHMIIENLVRSFINWRFDYPAGDLLPLQASDELLPFPLVEIAKTFVQTEEKITATTFVAVSLAWVAVYYIISRFRLLKTDW